jgi:hypothetical protein
VTDELFQRDIVEIELEETWSGRAEEDAQYTPAIQREF